MRFQHRPGYDTRVMSLDRRRSLHWYGPGTAPSRDVLTPGLGRHRGDEAVWR